MFMFLRFFTISFVMPELTTAQVLASCLSNNEFRIRRHQTKIFTMWQRKDSAMDGPRHISARG